MEEHTHGRSMQKEVHTHGGDLQKDIHTEGACKSRDVTHGETYKWTQNIQEGITKQSNIHSEGPTHGGDITPNETPHRGDIHAEGTWKGYTHGGAIHMERIHDCVLRTVGYLEYMIDSLLLCSTLYL